MPKHRPSLNNIFSHQIAYMTFCNTDMVLRRLCIRLAEYLLVPYRAFLPSILLLHRTHTRNPLRPPLIHTMDRYNSASSLRIFCLPHDGSTPITNRISVIQVLNQFNTFGFDNFVAHKYYLLSFFERTAIIVRFLPVYGQETKSSL